jgi:hypothetical protein
MSFLSDLNAFRGSAVFQIVEVNTILGAGKRSRDSQVTHGW